MFDAKTIATAIVEAAAGIAARTPIGAADQTIASILKSADQYLTVADNCLQTGEIETTIHALAAADAACRLVDVLMADPSNPAAVALAEPWARHGEVAA